MNITGRKKSISCDHWGYLFIAPFFVVYIIFSLFPLLSTFYNSFFENYMNGLRHVGPNFVGFDNFKAVLTNAEVLKYASNTLLMWLIGFVPQLFFSLLLAYWFSSPVMRIKGARFFKTVMYMPNLIMAAAFAMLFFTLFADNGPVNDMLVKSGFSSVRFMAGTGTVRGLVGLMNFLMWFGNTTILLMAAMLGIDPSLYEAASIDGANASQTFWKIAMPLIKPVLIYVLITSMMGGIQMFDVPQVLTDGEGTPNRMSMTLVMYLNKHLYSKNFGLGGAVSTVLFVLTAVLSLIVFKTVGNENRGKKR